MIIFPSTGTTNMIMNSPFKQLRFLGKISYALWTIQQIGTVHSALATQMSSFERRDAMTCDDSSH